MSQVVNEVEATFQHGISHQQVMRKGTTTARLIHSDDVNSPPSTCPSNSLLFIRHHWGCSSPHVSHSAIYFKAGWGGGQRAICLERSHHHRRWDGLHLKIVEDEKDLAQLNRVTLFVNWAQCQNQSWPNSCTAPGQQGTIRQISAWL